MKAFIRYAVIATVLFLLIGAEWWMSSPTVSRLTDNLPSKIRAAFNDPALQPWIMASLLVYVATFIIIQLRQQRKGPPRWRMYCLAATQALVAISYYRDYEHFGPGTTDALAFAGCCAIGLAFAFCISISSLPAEKWLKEISVILVLLLAASSRYSGDDWTEYRYKDVERATAIWQNPNTYGLLMSCGLVLALGLLAESSWNYAQSKAVAVPSTGNHKLDMLLVLPAILLLSGLIQSLSRGAWLGTTLASFWLADHFLQKFHFSFGAETARDFLQSSHRSFGWSTCNLKSGIILTLALCLLTFWTARHDEHPHFRRVFTLGNATDFSWRNRVLAYEQALQMIQEQLLEGYSLAQWEQIHTSYYQPAWQEDGSAIKLNDYFVKSIVNGIPDILFFWIYLALFFIPHQSNQAFSSNHGYTTRQITAAVTITLLVGFWFDGGIFKMSIGVIFWIYLTMPTNTSESKSV